MTFLLFLRLAGMLCGLSDGYGEVNRFLENRNKCNWECIERWWRLLCVVHLMVRRRVERESWLYHIFSPVLVYIIHYLLIYLYLVILRIHQEQLGGFEELHSKWFQGTTLMMMTSPGRSNRQLTQTTTRMQRKRRALWMQLTTSVNSGCKIYNKSMWNYVRWRRHAHMY